MDLTKRFFSCWWKLKHINGNPLLSLSHFMLEAYVVFKWNPWPPKHTFWHQDHVCTQAEPKLWLKTSTAFRDGGHLGFHVFEVDPLICECGAGSIWNQRTQKPLCTNFHAFFRMWTSFWHICPTTGLWMPLNLLILDSLFALLNNFCWNFEGHCSDSFQWTMSVSLEGMKAIHCDKSFSDCTFFFFF